jgi:flagellar motor protein MotB
MTRPTLFRATQVLFVQLALVLPASALAGEGAVSEILYFLEDDGRHALVYTTVRSDSSAYEIRLPASSATNEADQEFLYIFPEEHEWQGEDRDDVRTLKLRTGDFATLRRVDLASGDTLSRAESGNFSFTTPAGLLDRNRRGIWNSPDGFDRIAYTWVFPGAFEPVTYTANQPGTWSRRGNSVTYYGTDVNDLMFNITYRSRLNELYDELSDMFGKEDKINVKEDGDEVRVSIEATLLYPSGVAALSPDGRKVLKRVSNTLKKNDQVRIMVEGHTDSDRIVGSLAKKFPTNWELSSARSINVIRYLVSLGVDEERFESRAFSSTKPLSPNDTAEGKSKNRRIELVLAQN